MVQAGGIKQKTGTIKTAGKKSMAVGTTSKMMAISVSHVGNRLMASGITSIQMVR